jgi:hypothetical protein
MGRSDLLLITQTPLSATMKRIDQAIEEQQKHEILSHLKEFRVVIVIAVLVVIALLALVYHLTGKVIAETTLSGRLVGVHHVPARTSAGYNKLSIELANGDTVLVNAPGNLLIRAGSEVEIIRVETENNLVHYRFSRYREP